MSLSRLYEPLCINILWETSYPLAYVFSDFWIRLELCWKILLENIATENPKGKKTAFKTLRSLVLILNEFSKKNLIRYKLKPTKAQIDILAEIAGDDYYYTDSYQNVDFAEMYLENLSFLLFGKCPDRAKE